MWTVQEYLTVFRRERGWTRALVAATPEERFGWTPPGSGFTCGGMIRHLMQAEVFWRKLLTSAAEGRPYDPFQLSGSPRERRDAFSEPNVKASGSPRFGTSFAECLESWKEIQAQTEAAFGALDDRQLAEVVVHHPLTELEARLGEMLWVMLSHEVHHRGQLAAYLKQLDVDQPVLFS
jgi:uncharacterized damage-inducible protein DinB